MAPTPPPDTAQQLAEQSYLAVERIGVASVVAVLLLVLGFTIVIFLIAPLVRAWQARLKTDAEDRRDERRLREKQLESHEHLASVIATNTEVMREAKQVQSEQADKLTIYTLAVNRNSETIVGKLDGVHSIALTNGEKLDKHGERLDKIAALLLSVNQQLAELLREIDGDNDAKAALVSSALSVENGASAPMEQINPS